MNQLKHKWKEPFYIFPIEHFTALKEIFKEGIADVAGSIEFSQPKYRLIDLHYKVYEKEELNHMTKEQLSEYFKMKIEETGYEHYGEALLSEYRSHMCMEVGHDDYLHLISVDLYKKKKGIGTRMLAWLENYAREQGFKGVLIRGTESEAMNHIAVKRGYLPIHTTIEERVEFGKKQGFRYNTNVEIKYDSNGLLYGYYALTF